MKAPRISREQVSDLVRRSVYGRLGREVTGSGAPLLVVNSSARHMHVTQDELEALFGEGYELGVHKWLYQDGQFASTKTVTMIGPRKRIIPNLRILGPCRDITQIELAYTDAIQLGIDVPVRMSGDIEGTPGAYVMGPKGMIEMGSGVIRAARHVHMGPSDAAFYGVKHKDYMKLRVVSDKCTTMFADLLVRVDPSFKLEVHIDTDEANAADLANASMVELVR